jgi:hypothetical protein
MKAEIRDNNEKFEVLEDTFLSWMDIHQARTEAIEEEINAKMDTNQKILKPRWTPIKKIWMTR